MGKLLVAAGLFLLSLTSADTSMVWVGLAMFVLGIGLGCCMQPLLLIMQSAVPPAEIGVATSSSTFFRQIGGTLGVAVFLSVLFGGVGQNIATATEEAARTPEYQAAVAAGEGVSPEVIAQVQDDSSIIDQMDPVIAHPFKVGFAESMNTVFLMAAGVGGLAFLVLLLMPHVELRAQSAQAAAAAQASAEPI